MNIAARMSMAAIVAGCFVSAGAPLTVAQDDSGRFETKLPELQKLKLSGEPVPAQKDAEPAPVMSGDADMAPFFKRLEDIGLDTKELRDLTAKIEVYFSDPGSDAAAQYGYILNNIYLPPEEYKAKDGSKVRYDLDSVQIDTLIHEYTHAAQDLTASEAAPDGTPARAHGDAVAYVYDSLRKGNIVVLYGACCATHLNPPTS
ncbi:MAG: hypothetical protein HY927_10745 [Elusimicrobia bacterium]|nr:hypothetical protein [Elusimicrobiota bacterium]